MLVRPFGTVDSALPAARFELEVALAHMVQNNVAAADARSDLLERWLLMDNWEDYLDDERGQVVPLRRWRPRLLTTRSDVGHRPAIAITTDA